LTTVPPSGLWRVLAVRAGLFLSELFTPRLSNAQQLTRSSIRAYTIFDAKNYAIRIADMSQESHARPGWLVQIGQSP